MNDNISPEKRTTPVPVLTTERITGPFFKVKEYPAIGIARLREAKTGETREEATLDTEPDIYLTSKESRRKSQAQTGWGRLEKEYYDMDNKIDTGEALTQEEMKELFELIARVPGGGKDEEWEYGLYTGRLIIDAAKKEGQDGFNAAWERMKNPATRSQEMLSRPNLAAVWYYFEIHDVDPKNIKVEQVVALGQAIEAIEKGEKIPDSVLKILAARNRNKDRVFDKMKAKESKEIGEKDGWKDEQTKLKAYESMLGLHQKEIAVNAQKFWEKMFLPVIEARLTAMRSPTVARLNKMKWEGEDWWYLGITRARDMRKPKDGRVYAPQLAMRTVASGTLLGNYLNRMGVGEKWRATAYLQELYWGLYMGQWIDEAEARQDAGTKDIFARLDSEVLHGSDFRAYTGMDEIAKLMTDERFVDALEILYTIGGRVDEKASIKGRLEILGGKYGFDPNKDLPEYVTDAVMWAQIFALDARSLSYADRRKRVYFMREYHHKQAMQLMGKDWQQVVEVLGYTFKLTETPLLMMGYVPPLNIDAIDYHALVEDERLYRPDLYPDQPDLFWQNVSFYCLQQRDPSLRTRVPAKGRLNRPVPVGRMGEYCPYDNDRVITDVEGREHYDHREAFYSRIEAMYAQDQSFQVKPERKGKGKAGWDNGLRKQVSQMLGFLKDKRDDTIRGVRIQTNGQEIFFNDELAKLLYKYEIIQGTPEAQIQYPPQEIALLDQYLNMRQVLRDIRAPGLVWSLDKDDPEVLDRLEARNDLMVATLYNLNGEKARISLLHLMEVAPFRTLGEQRVTPGMILETAKELGHRFQDAQKYPCLYKFYLFAMIVIEMRMRDLELASMSDLDKVIDPQGEVQYGVWGMGEMVAEHGYELKEKGILGDYYRARRQIEEELQEMGYLDKMKDQRMTLIGHGHYENWDQMMEQAIWKEWGAEGMNWSQTRTWPAQHRFRIWRRMARFYNPHQPIEGWEILDVTASGLTGERDAVYQGEEVEGKKIDIMPVMTDFDPQKAKPVVVVVKGKEQERVITKGERVAILEIKGPFCLIAEPNEKGERLSPLGWVRFNNLTKAFKIDDKRRAVRTKQRSYRFEDLSETQIEKYCIRLTDQQAGELFGGIRLATYQGTQMPVMTDSDPQKAKPVVVGNQRLSISSGTRVAVLEIKDNNWCRAAGIKKDTGELIPLGWIQATNWQQDFDFLSQKVEGYPRPGEVMHQGSRLIWTKTKKGWRWQEEIGPWSYDRMVNKWSFKKDEAGFKREFHLPGDDLDDRDATYPYLVLASDEARDELLDVKYMEIFHSLYGRGEGVSPGGYHQIPLGPDYPETEKAGMDELFRGVYWLFCLMRTHECRLLARNMYRQYKDRVIADAPLLKTKEGHLLAIEDMVGEGRIWGEDIETMKKYEKELIPRLFKREHKDEKLIKKILGVRLDFNEIKNWLIHRVASVAGFEFQVLGKIRVNPILDGTVILLTNFLGVGQIVGQFAKYLFSNSVIKAEMIKGAVEKGFFDYLLFSSDINFTVGGVIGTVVLGVWLGHLLAERLHIWLQRNITPEREALVWSREDLAYLVDPVKSHKKFKPKQ